MSNKDTNLIWLDLEMTGLDPEADKIIEIATVVTDSSLQVVAEGPVLVIHQSQACLDGMDDWNQRQHQQSGLIDKVLKSTVSEKEAEQATLAFLTQHVNPGVSPLCGNSICQDRRFMVRYMPDLIRFFHYRHLDVSTLKELARRWYPSIYRGYRKEPKHLALSDIYDSIEELKFYRDSFMRDPEH